MDYHTLLQQLHKGEVHEIYFFYGEDEKAYKTCYKLVKKAYPGANYQIKKGHGHMSYSCECTEEYINELKRILS